MIYEVWGVRCDVPSDWDMGDGECLESHQNIASAERAVRQYQVGGHAAWIVPIEDAP